MTDHKNEASQPSSQPAAFTKKVNDLSPEQKEINRLKKELRKEMEVNDSYLAAIHNARIEKEKWQNLCIRSQEKLCYYLEREKQDFKSDFQPVKEFTIPLSTN